jgi:long-chain fatty acid transport protein
MLPFAGLFHHVFHSASGDNCMRQHVLSALLLWCGVPTLLAAQGYGIYEQGTCSMGRAGTGVAAPCGDGSAMFFNPAGLAGLQGGHATIGVTLLDVKGGFTDDIFQQKTALDNPLLAIPQVYVAYAATPKLGVGIGLFAPYGLETKWPLTFDGRFAGYKNIIRSIYLQPTVAYQVTPWLALGGGVDIVMGKVELNQRLDLAQAPVPLPPPAVPVGTTFGQFGIPPGTDFADAHLEATKTAVTAHWGGIIKVNDKLSIGGRYLMHAKLDYSGTGTFTQVPTSLVIPADIIIPSSPPDTIHAGTPVDGLLQGLGVFQNILKTQAITTTITNPEQVVFGLAYKVRSDWTLFGDYQFTRWGKRLSVLNINFANPLLNRVLYEGYQNTNGVRVAAEWVKDLKWTFRGGYLYSQGAAPAQTVTPLLPEGARNEFTGGFTVKLAPGFTADLAYQYIKQNDRRGRTREPIFNQVPTTALNNGVYNFHAHLFGVSLSYAF